MPTLHANYMLTLKCLPVDPTATRQLKNLSSRHNTTTPSPPIQQSAHGRYHNCSHASLETDLDGD